MNYYEIYYYINKQKFRCQNASPASQGLVNETFFYQRQENEIPTAKCILIDMEPKLSFTKQEGSGNNWAYGFNVHGPKTEEEILKRINTLLEETDYMQGFYMISSLAGGTGSGVGSYLQEVMYDNYPELNLININIMPHLTGEVILQSLNSILTISHLYKYGQGMILLSNDQASMSCNNLLGLKNPSLAQINQVMSTTLASYFWPAIGTKHISSTLQNRIDYFDEPILNLLSDTRYKILQLSHIPQMPKDSKAFTKDTWINLEKRIIQMTLSGTQEFNMNWSQKIVRNHAGTLMIARGSDSIQQEFELANNQNFNLIKDTHQFNGNEKSICTLSNNQSVCQPMELMIERASQMYQENAYIYQYEKFGVDKEHFLESLGLCESILQNYQKMK